MAASKFYKDYALKTNDQKQYLESYEDRVAIVSLYLGRGDVSKAKQFASMIVNKTTNQRHQPFKCGKKQKRRNGVLFLVRDGR